mgnify:CR=1 FL=1
MNLEVIKIKPLKQKISITLDEDIIKRVRVLAEDCDRSLSQYINLVLRDYLKALDADENSVSKYNP